MRCPNCNARIGVSKNLRPGKNDTPDTCDECGESLDKSEGGNRDLIMK